MRKSDKYKLYDNTDNSNNVIYHVRCESRQIHMSRSIYIDGYLNHYLGNIEIRGK